MMKWLHFIPPAVLACSLFGAGGAIASPGDLPKAKPPVQTEAADAAGAEEGKKVDANQAPANADAATSKDKDEKTDGEDDGQQVLARNIAVASVGKKPWTLIGSARFRSLVVSDDDPSNGRSMQYRLSGLYKIFKGGTLFGRLGMSQRFVAQPDESGFRLEDVLLGGIYMHRLSLKGIGINRSIGFMHRAGVYLPTSFESRNQDLYISPEWLTQARMQLAGPLAFGVTGLGQYRWHKYAERAGQQGGQLPRVVLLGLAFLEVTPLASKKYGALIVGVDAYNTQSILHPAQFSGDDNVSDTTFVRAGYGWDLYATYVPIPNIAVSASLSQGGNVLRDGVVNTFWFHRDETAFSLGLTARY